MRTFDSVYLLIHGVAVSLPFSLQILLHSRHHSQCNKHVLACGGTEYTSLQSALTASSPYARWLGLGTVLLDLAIISFHCPSAEYLRLLLQEPACSPACCMLPNTSLLEVLLSVHTAGPRATGASDCNVHWFLRSHALTLVQHRSHCC
jgi:hypothetical protein